MFRKKLSILIIWLGVTCGFYLLSNFYRADLLFNKSQVLLKKRDISKALLLIEKAITLNPHEPSYRWGRARILVVRLVDSNEESVREHIYTEAISAIELNPDNLVTKRNLLPIVYFLSVEDLNKVPGQNNINQNYISFTQGYFFDLKNIYAHDVGVLIDVAGYEKKLELQKDYESTVSGINDLRPDILEWYPLFQ